MTEHGTVESTLHGLARAYLEGRSSLQDFGGSYLTVFLAHDADAFRDGETWLLFNLINEQLTFVLEESASHGGERLLEQNFRNWLIDAVHVLEWPGSSARRGGV